jgi:REP element-mobilizing transposase RayT
MPRRARIEYEGAFYHLLCRGDRRDAIFLDNEDRQGFLTTLGEACERSGFVVHSYVLMDNHYHLLLETPAGNLVAGMKWFQGTYTARFNARHRLRGHLFAGRYKAVLVEREEPAYGRVVSDYIHLNPARAGIVNAKNPQLRTYKWSSFPIFCGEGKPPKWLRAADVFSWHRFDWRRAADRRAYGKYLQRRAEESWKQQSGRKAREAGELLKELRPLPRQRLGSAATTAERIGPMPGMLAMSAVSASAILAALMRASCALIWEASKSSNPRSSSSRR